MKTFLLLVVFSSSVLAQGSSEVIVGRIANKSNYEKAMALESATEQQLDSIVYLSINYSYSNKDSCLTLGEKSIELGQDHQDSPIYANALLELGDTYRIYGDYEKSYQYLVEGLELYKSMDDIRQVAYAQNKLGAFFAGKGENEKAINKYLEALKTYEMLKDTQNIFKPNLNIAWIFYRLNQIDKAQQYNDEAYNLATAIKDKRQTGMALNNRGIYLKSILDSFQEKMDSLPELKDVYEDSIKNYRKKIYQNHEESLRIAQDLNDQMAVMRSLVNMAIIKDDEGNYKEAIQLARQAEDISENIGSLELSLSNKNILCKALRNNGQLKNSIQIGEESLKLAKANNMSAYTAGANNELLKSYKSAGMYEKALQTLEEINDYIRVTNEEKTTQSIANAEAKYQNIKKENEILQLAENNSRIQKQRNIILGGSAFMLLAGFFTQRMRKLRRERNDKKAFAEALIYAQEEERKRIARDLHDGIGQSLLLLKKDLDKTHESTLENRALLGQTLEEVRSISRELHPLQLEKFGLKAAVEDIVERLTEISGIFISKEISLTSTELPSKTQLNIYRVIQEALNNVIKHSEATAGKIEIIQTDQIMKCRILDNGKGFDHELSIAKSKSLGLQTMNERIANVGGTFAISKNNPSGTIISFQIPLTS